MNQQTSIERFPITNAKAEFYECVDRVKKAFEDSPEQCTEALCSDFWESTWQEIADFTYHHYSEPHRRHHGLEHIILGIRTLGELTEDDPITLLAWLFHDVIFIMGAQPGVNETMSAYIMNQLTMPVIDVVSRDEAERMILATWTHEVPNWYPGKEEYLKLMLDFDLETLGVPWELFERYRLNIEGEASPLIPSLAPQSVFEENTKTFARSVLEREHIYLTEEFAHLEAPARENLQKLL